MKLSMSYILILLGLSLIVLLAFSCKSKQKAISQQEVISQQEAISQQIIQKDLTAAQIRDLPKVLEYSKSPCYGTCPHFTMSVYEGGWTIFEGKQHTAKEGTTIVQLTADQLATLRQQFQAADLWSCEKSYGDRIMDIPTTTVHYFEDQRDRSVQWKMRQPAQLQTLDSQLMELVYAQGWVKKRTTAKDRSLQEVPEVIIDNELIIQIKDKMDAKEWASQYKEYGLQLKKPISRTANMHLFTFDTKLIDSDKMMEMILADKQVSRAEFNKRLQQRTR